MSMRLKKPIWKSRVVHLLVLASILLVSISVAASQNHNENSSKRTLVGTWTGTTVINGQLAYGMATFSSDGTFVHTGASKNNVQAHGVWKRVGPLTFVEQNREFVYQDGELALFADTTSMVTLSEDGMNATSESVVDLKLLDGTVINTVPLTVHSTRMTLDI